MPALRVPALLFAFLALVVGCAAPPGARDGTGRQGAEAGSAPSRTLVMALRHNMPDLSHKIPGPGAQDVLKRIFNAPLVIIDGSGVPQPYLAESLPQFGTGSWQVFPDGKMETSYLLKAGLTWHDGQPLTADDFVFAWQVYLHRGLSVFSTAPEDQMESVTALDARTLVIRWKTPFPEASQLRAGDLDPLPRHILGASFNAVQEDPSVAEAFVNSRYWNHEYVGAGPFRLERWEPGTEWEGSAFAGHALGRPKIDRIIVRLIPDNNTVLANLLGGVVHFAPDHTLAFEHGQLLTRDWVPTNRGAVILRRSSPLSMDIQLRPEYVGHPAQLDVRVRRAMAHLIDRRALDEGIFDGRGAPTEHMVPEGVPFFADVERALTKYPYDPRRTEQLMNEAGFTKDREGIYADASGQRFRTELRYSAGPEWERRVAILSDTFKRAGVLADPFPLPEEAGRDRETRSTFPGLASRGGGITERHYTAREIASPANRWGGNNRTGWSTAEYDRIYEAFVTTLDRGERTRQFVEMQKLLSEHLPMFIFHFSLLPNAHVAELKGPEAGVPAVGNFSPGTTDHWSIHQWQLFGVI